MHGLLQVIYSLASGISPHLLALLASAGICGLILAGVGMVIAATAFVHRSLTAVRDRWTNAVAAITIPTPASISPQIPADASSASRCGDIPDARE